MNNILHKLCLYILFSAVFVDFTSLWIYKVNNVLQTEVSLWDPAMYIH